MASSGKRKTTFAKLARESKLRERRQEKAAKKVARKRAAENPPPRSTKHLRPKSGSACAVTDFRGRPSEDGP